MTLGDGICDMNLNSEICEYDYGDCCPDDSDSYGNLVGGLGGEESCYEIIVVGAESKLNDSF